MRASGEIRRTSGPTNASFLPESVPLPTAEQDPRVCHQGILWFLEEQPVLHVLVPEPAPGGSTVRHGAATHQRKSCNVLSSTLSWETPVWREGTTDDQPSLLVLVRAFPWFF